MFRGFNLVMTNADPDFLAAYGEEAKARVASKSDRATLSQLLLRQQIDGDNVKTSWFSDKPSHIFLSHSGSDRALAYALADYLKAMLDLDVFVDSQVWGGANTLLEMIDDLYCKRADGDGYSYNKRNYSTSHVHMMLATALTEMIDRCECVIFLNTPQSIQASDAEKFASKRVASPWIYHELMMTRLLRRRSRREVSLVEEGVLARADAQDAALQVSYEAPLAHLKKMTPLHIENWANCPCTGLDALDWLYDRHPPSAIERTLLQSRG